MSEEGGEPTRRRRRSRSPPAAADSLPDDDDLLREILLRLPPQPSSLPRASAVCKRWQRLATDPKFLRCFIAHHRKPPLLGYFKYVVTGLVFTPVLDPPDRIPPARLHCIIPDTDGAPRDKQFLGCRHGRVLVMDRVRKEVLICDPITGGKHCVTAPPEFTRNSVYGEVVCAAADRGHVHGSCHSSPFKVVLMSLTEDHNWSIARVYSSETGIWGNLITTAVPSDIYGASITGTLVGNALYWLLLMTDDILEFDLGGQEISVLRILEFDLDLQSLAVIMGPPSTYDFLSYTRQIIRAEDGALGLVIFSYPSIQVWHREVDCHGVATWLLYKTIRKHKILGLPQIERGRTAMQCMLGYSEDTNAIFIIIDFTVYMVQLKSMQSKRLHEIDFRDIANYYPFTSFYTPGIANAGGCDGPEMVHDT
ncbi:uncharacterized protein LOC100839686 [Brachypodium distachyon]|uniref:Uncharacterized protein n=1 Tax=Brachypodium distachyon TaxID=15368 RepID=A0A0Q3FTA6_BRADI|nr:uncharacterized protein LOC100839686 [Brachypodium distachyon]KQK02391.1 hypothetical protein BRADI_2g01157v3 [Brachypodium distachyon]|eukprot:XP_003565252.3 uncharacterized protein LOC100839686 [Brachypodium distachyon]